MNTRRIGRARWTAFVLVAATFAGGCAATRQAADAKPSGFLTGKFYAGGEGQSLLVYINPEAQWQRYDKVLIEPVTIWHSQANADLPADEAQVLVDYLDSSLRHELSKDYTLVDRPGKGVLRVRVAITEAEGSARVADAVSTVVPALRLLSGAKQVATGTAAFVGRAGIEGEIKDSMTDERLAAAIDRRAGQKRLRGVGDTWDDVRGAFDFWAERLRVRLAEFRAGKP